MSSSAPIHGMSDVTSPSTHSTPTRRWRPRVRTPRSFSQGCQRICSRAAHAQEITRLYCGQCANSVEFDSSADGHVAAIHRRPERLLGSRLLWHCWWAWESHPRRARWCRLHGRSRSVHGTLVLQRQFHGDQLRGVGAVAEATPTGRRGVSGGREGQHPADLGPIGKNSARSVDHQHGWPHRVGRFLSTGERVLASHAEHPLATTFMRCRHRRAWPSDRTGLLRAAYWATTGRSPSRGRGAIARLRSAAVQTR